jgi:DNA-binding transcriptional MocR family regulator
MTRPEGGYFVWLELPKRVDAMELYHAAFAEGISTAPGPMFSPSSRFQRCIRVNTGQVWTAKIDGALSTLGRMVTQRVGATGVK